MDQLPPAFVRALKRDPERRSPHDIQNIFIFLRALSCLERSDDACVLNFGSQATLIKKAANEILYCRGELNNSWFILIHGSVFIDGNMFLPVCSFGRRVGGAYRRANECLTLEPSWLISIEGGQEQSSDWSEDSAESVSISSSDNNTDEVDLSGLVESVVDSEEEEEEEDDSVISRDCVRECLEKDPGERTESDINLLLEFTNHLQAFHDLTLNVRRSLCGAMVFAVVPRAGTVVLSDGEELDSWSVLVNGAVEVVDEDGRYVLTAGEAFGLPPTLAKHHFRGSMVTTTDDCQFVCVTQENYFAILKQGLDNQKVVKKDGEIVLVTENRGGSECIVRASEDELLHQLVANEPLRDATYVEDFLLTHRIFSNHQVLLGRLGLWFEDLSLRDRVTRIVLLWVNNHFSDFEQHKELYDFLLRFQKCLERTKENSGQLRLLQIACSAKSRPRRVTLARNHRDDPLPFHLIGGGELGYGLFLSHVSVPGESLGLRTGDEVVEVNGQPLGRSSLSEALDKLKSITHLVLLLKCNFLGYHECIHNAPAQHKRAVSAPVLTTSNNKQRLKKALANFLLPRKEIPTSPAIDFPEGVVKVFRADQLCKFLLVNKETTAREVTMLALQEFEQTKNASRDYALFQVSAIEGVLKQTRLSETLDSLAERLPLGARYYIKRADEGALLPDELVGELAREAQVNLLQLNPTELALQLTLEDYHIFRHIEATEYVEDLFGDGHGWTGNLQKFAELVNRETFWVVGEVVREKNLTRRVSVIKRFLKVALVCKESRNFNSLFAIVSGLGNSAVSRLKLTWEKLGSKYNRVFNELQQLMDPSRNMGRYRGMLSSCAGASPLVPFYPVVRKDLTFIHLGNSTVLDGLINFEKMRMVAKEVRGLLGMAAASFDTANTPALAAMNQLNATRLTTTQGKRRKRPLHPKRIFEEAHMVRKVKAYLNNLVVDEDESNLHSQSLLCEPPKKSTNRPSSPTPSVSSSASQESKVKFGSSPSSYQKLLSLSEGNRPRQPPPNTKPPF